MSSLLLFKLIHVLTCEDTAILGESDCTGKSLKSGVDNFGTVSRFPPADLTRRLKSNFKSKFSFNNDDIGLGVP